MTLAGQVTVNGTDYAPTTALELPGAFADAAHTGPGDLEHRPYDNRYGPIINGRLLLSVPGAVLDGFDIPAWVELAAQEITLTRNVIHPSYAPTNVGVVTSRNPKVTGAVIEQNTLRPDVASVWFTGVIGHDFTAFANDVSHCVDGFGTYRTDLPGDVDLNTAIDFNTVHDLVFKSPDLANHPKDQPVSAVHADGWQHQRGFNVRFTRNRVDAFIDPDFSPDILRDAAHPNGQGGFNKHFPGRQANSCIQITNGLGSVGDLAIVGNYLDGGGYAINVGPGVYLGLGVISGNHFGRGMTYPASAIGLPKGAVATLSGNIWHDTLAPASVNRF